MVILNERGYFWNADIAIPETSFAPESAVYGTLEIGDNGTIRLDLDGLINGIGSIDWSNKKRNETISIAGKLKCDASSILLIEALNNGQIYSSHNISDEKFVALYCLKSDCEVEELKRLAASVQLTRTYCKSYNDMFGLAPIKFERQEDNVRVEYKSVSPLKVQMDDRSFKIDHSIVMPYGDERSLSSLKMDCSSIIDISFGRYVSIPEIAHEHRMIQDLLLLLTNIRSPIEWPKVKSEISDAYATLYYLRGNPATEVFEVHNSWTVLSQIKSNIASIIEAWFVKRDTIGAGIYLYLSTRRGIDMYSEQRFMTLMWGLEAFHRAVAKPQSNEKVRAKIDRILKAVEPKDRRWLAGRLDGPIEPGLDSRIYDLFKALPLGFQSAQLRELAETCRSIRNNVSHFGEASRDQVHVDHQRLDKLFNAISYLYHARILLEIGVCHDHIQWIFTKSFRSSIIQSSLMSVGLSLDSGILPIPQSGPI